MAIAEEPNYGQTNGNYQVEATSSVDRRRVTKRAVQVLGHLALHPDLLQLRHAEPSLRLPRLVGAAAAAAASLALPGPPPSPFHAVPGPGIACTHGSRLAGPLVATHTHVSLDLELEEDDQEMGAMQASYKREEERRWMV